MIELDRNDYALGLLPVRQVGINTMFAEAVLAQHMSGKVYADSREHPQTFYVSHSYGMSLLFGGPGDEAFIRDLSTYITNQSGAREQAEWLQADPEGEWSGVIDAIAASHNRWMDSLGLPPEEAEDKKIQRYSRVNFRFDPDAYRAAKTGFTNYDKQVIRTTGELFRAHSGSVIPRYFWRDEEHFVREGIGFTLLLDGEVASTAFSSCRIGRQLEIGIETAAAHQGQGYAVAVCSMLIEYCLEQGLEPIWACRQENVGSYYLAQKLGFRPTVTLPYYRLPV